MPGFNNDINELPPVREPDPREIEMREKLIAFARADEQRILDKHNAERDGLWRDAIEECAAVGHDFRLTESQVRGILAAFQRLAKGEAS